MYVSICVLHDVLKCYIKSVFILCEPNSYHAVSHVEIYQEPFLSIWYIFQQILWRFYSYHMQSVKLLY